MLGTWRHTNGKGLGNVVTPTTQRAALKHALADVHHGILRPGDLANAATEFLYVRDRLREDADTTVKQVRCWHLIKQCA